MATQKKVKAWDMLQAHPIAKALEDDAKLALACEVIDLYDSLQGMILADFVTAYFEADAKAAEEAAEVTEEATDEATEEATDEPAEEEEEQEGEPSANGDGAERPQSMVGMRAVYRFVGRNVLTDEDGITKDSGGTVAFVDVEGQPWSNIRRDHVFPIDPKNYRVVHVSPREAKEINGWLEGGKPVKGEPEGKLLRSLFCEFPEHPEYTERCAFAVMNGKRPYIDRFVQKPNGGFEDDQKPVTWLFGEHCFRVRKKDYVVKVVTP